MQKTIKKILTEDDLLKFCQEQQFTTFNSKDTGYQLALKIPTTFEIDDTVDKNHRGMMRLKFRIFHIGLNRNKSYVSKESAEKAMNTIADRPVLAAIHQLNDGTWDFEGHEMEIVKDDKGNEELRYIESQVGSFSSEPAFWEHDDVLNKDYVCAYAYISEEYTKACDIIRSKQGSKNSCELFIDDFSYNAKEKYLELNSFYLNASTLLGSHDDGTEIQEGMEGSRADIEVFSVKNNSVKFDKDAKMIELLENLNKTLSNFNKQQESPVYTLSKKGGNKEIMTKFKELLAKYNKTAEDITFDYSELSDEELEAKFAETFSEDNSNKLDGNTTNEPSNDEGGGVLDSVDSKETASEEGNETSVSSDNTQEDKSDSEGTADRKCEEENFEKMTRTFEISHDDIRYALYKLLGQFEDMDNEWYYIVSVFNDHFIYESWNSQKIFGQKYKVEEDNVSFVDERYNLHAEYLTDNEYAELKEMRSNYSSILSQLNTYKAAEDYADKMTVFEDEAYANYLETEEFKSLMSDETVKKFSKDELIEKADATLGRLVKKNKAFSFSENSTNKPRKNKVTIVSDFDDAADKNIYGDYFKSINNV